MKKIIIIGIIVMVAVGTVIIATIPKDTTEYMDSQEKGVAVLTQAVPTDIVLFGDDLPFPEDLMVRKIDEITDTNLKHDKNYQFIILSNLHGNVKVSNEAFEIIAQKVKNKESFLFCTGTSFLQQMINAGIMGECSADDDVILCHSGYYLEGEAVLNDGVYYPGNANSDEKLIAKLIIIDGAEWITKNFR